MEAENSSNLKVFGVSASHHPSVVWSDPAISAVTCSCPHLVDSKTPLSVLQCGKMNPLRDWKRSGLCCPRNHTRREWNLWDEVIEIQIEIHSAGTFSSNAYFLGDWFVWGRLRRFNSLAFPTTFLLFQVLNVPSHSTRASSQTGPQGLSPLSVLQFPDASHGDIATLHRLLRNCIKMEADLSPWQKLGSLIFRERRSYSPVIRQPFVKPRNL